MGLEHRIQDSFRFTKWLKFGLVASLVLFFLVFNIVPKTHCDVCDFDYNGGTNAEEAMDYYQADCLREAYKPNKSDIYVNLDDIEVTQDNDYMKLSFDDEDILTKEEMGASFNNR